MKSYQYRKLVLLGLSLMLVFSFAVSTSAQSEESNTFGDSETTETVDAPIVGWYLIPVLGAMRRKRHDLNNRSYDDQNDEDV